MNPSSMHLLQCPHRDKLKGKQNLEGFLVENCICETHFYVEDLWHFSAVKCQVNRSVKKRNLL